MTIFLKPIIARFTETYSGEAFLWFRRAFCLKLFFFAALVEMEWTAIELALIALLFVAAWNGGARTLYWPGILTLFLYRLWQVILIFPYTLNHAFYECVALLILMMFPAPAPRSQSLLPVSGLAPHLLQATIVLVWFYAGLQKVVHGYYLNGEMMAMYGMFAGGKMTPFFMEVIHRIEWLSSASSGNLPLACPESVDQVVFEIPIWVKAVFISVSWVIVISELLFPPLTLLRRMRKMAIAAMIALQVIIGICTLELSFSLTSIACLLLFFPAAARRNFVILILGQILVFGLTLGGVV